MNQRNKYTPITTENWTVDFVFGLKVKIAFAKYENTEAVTNAIEFDQKAFITKLDIAIMLLYAK